jgi:hypothetical protein
MVYPINALERRRRRRRWVLVLLTVAIVVSVIVLAVRYRTEERGVADYLAVAEEVALIESKAAGDLESMFTSLASIDRPEVMRRLENLEEDTSAASGMLAGVNVTPAASEAHAFLLVATKSWNGAVAALDESIVQVLDEPREAGGDVALRRAFDQLAVGDLAYTEFLDAVDRVDADLVTRDFEPVAFAAVADAVALGPTSSGNAVTSP